MKDVIITISRQYGCGAREVGEKLAKKLGVPYYDKHLVELAAQRSGLTPEFIEKTEQRSTGGVFYGTNTTVGTMGGVVTGGTSLADQVYLAQFSTIREIAAKGSCVIVGRCADAILREDYRCLNIFLYADLQKRVERAIKVYGVDPDKAEKTVKDTDKARAKHYKYYSDLKWGAADNYDISMNMASFSIDGAVEILADSINALIK